MNNLLGTTLMAQLAALQSSVVNAEEGYVVKMAQIGGCPDCEYRCNGDCSGKCVDSCYTSSAP